MSLERLEHDAPSSPETPKSFEGIFDSVTTFAAESPVFTLVDLHEFLRDDYPVPELPDFFVLVEEFKSQLMGYCKARGLNPAWYDSTVARNEDSLHAFVANDIRERGALPTDEEARSSYVEAILQDLFQKTPVVSARYVEFYLRTVKGLGRYADDALRVLVEKGLLMCVDDVYMLPDVALAEPTEEDDEVWEPDEDDAEELEEPVVEEPDDDDDVDDDTPLVLPALLPVSQPVSQAKKTRHVVDIFAEDLRPIPLELTPEDDIVLPVNFVETVPKFDPKFLEEERFWAEVMLDRLNWIAAREDGVHESIFVKYMTEQMVQRYTSDKATEKIEELIGRLWTRNIVVRDFRDPADPYWGLHDDVRPRRHSWSPTLKRYMALLKTNFVPAEK